MKTHKSFRRLLAFLLLTIVMVNILSEVIKATEPSATNCLKGFYMEEKDSLDVVVIGASEVYTGYSPALAWKEQGYTSYSYAAPGIGGNLYKYMLTEVLKRQKPKVVAFEIHGFTEGDSYFSREANIHNVLDNLNWSENRIQAIQSIVPEEKRMSYYFPLQTYHSVWENKRFRLANLGIKFYYQIFRTCYLKGLTTTSDIMPIDKRRTKGKNHFTETSRTYLEDLLSYCKEQGIENVLFFRAPHGELKDKEEKIAQVEELIKSYGYDFLDCDNWIDEKGICLQTDFYDAQHMNINGAEKFTRSFAENLKELYPLPERQEHEDKLIDSWDLAAQKSEELMRKCKEDMLNNVKRRYLETSFLIDSPVDERD